MNRELTDINEIVSKYEVIEFFGGNTTAVAMEIYKVLINDGALPGELKDGDIVEDIFDIDYEYDFMSSDYKEKLIMDIAIIAELDSLTTEELAILAIAVAIPGLLD